MKLNAYAKIDDDVLLYKLIYKFLPILASIQYIIITSDDPRFAVKRTIVLQPGALV